MSRLFSGWALWAVAAFTVANAENDSAVLAVHTVEGQPLAANVRRLAAAMHSLGEPFPEGLETSLHRAIDEQDGEQIQRLLDPTVLIEVSINPELRVRSKRGPGAAHLRQFGFTPHIIKVVNEGTTTAALRLKSAQAGTVYAGAALAILKRQAQTGLATDANRDGRTDRFLSVEVFERPPMTVRLSGLNVEYVIALLSSSESGKREATISADIGAGSEDLEYRADVPILFEVAPAIPVPLHIRDETGEPSIARLTFRDLDGRVVPPQAKRIAPDLFFQPHIYRFDGETVLLAPGRYSLVASRGPEYVRLQREVEVADEGQRPPRSIAISLERWIRPADAGFYSGDHHIHGAGCSHYTHPTEGVTPGDMFRQVKGEGLNVGCVLTWGPCFEFQRRFFSASADQVSEPMTVLKYDLEISGFGSAALGHVCLLNLQDQTYPGSEGTKERGWPTWTVPVMRWAKRQGGITGYPHSALHVRPTSSAEHLLAAGDTDGNRHLDTEEAPHVLLPEPAEQVDEDGNNLLSLDELASSSARASQKLPNLALPGMDGAGAMEVFISVTEGVCDFISAMNTARIPEWNTWYHIMNCGFPLKLSGETDFPCMSSLRVGQGRVYVQLGRRDKIDFGEWCRGLAAGKSYVSDGFSHALLFAVDGVQPGNGVVKRPSAGPVTVRATVAFAPAIPRSVAHGSLVPEAGMRMVGDTVNLHASRSDEQVSGGLRKVELVGNGRVLRSAEISADGNLHDLEWELVIERSTWLALRQFPQLHTNPVEVLVGGLPIRASKDSARWCLESVDLLWKNRHRHISAAELPEARRAYDRARKTYRQLIDECPDGAD